MAKGKTSLTRDSLAVSGDHSLGSMKRTPAVIAASTSFAWASGGASPPRVMTRTC
jgi:hypothetical protein